MTIKISVIIPVYNKEKYIKKCLDSLVNQTISEIEIICINDGSTDDSLSILEEFSEKDSLEKLYDNSKEYDSELVLFNAIEHLPNNQLNKRTYYSEDIEGVFNYKDKKDIVMNNYLIVCTKLHKLSFLKNNKIEFSESELFEDVYFHIKSILNAERITYVNKYFYNYRRTEKNTRQNDSIRSNKCFIFLDTLNDVKSFLIEKNAYDYLEDNYLKFKITEIKNLFDNINQSYKKDFYNLIKNDFNNNPIKENSLNKLPLDKRQFYQKINETKNYEEYANTLNTNKDVKKIKRIFNKIKTLF